MPNEQTGEWWTLDKDFPNANINPRVNGVNVPYGFDIESPGATGVTGTIHQFPLPFSVLARGQIKIAHGSNSGSANLPSLPTGLTYLSTDFVSVTPSNITTGSPTTTNMHSIYNTYLDVTIPKLTIYLIDAQTCYSEYVIEYMVSRS